MRPFGDRREALRIPLEEAAFRLRISPGYLRSLELARRPLSLPLARRMTRVYHCDLDSLVRHKTTAGRS